MEHIAKHYGGFILAGIVFVLMLILVFSGIQDGEGNQGIRNIIAAHMDTEGTDYGAYTDFEIYEKESTNAFPQIHYQDVGALPVGTVAFLDNVEVTDYAGRSLAYAGESVDENERDSGYIKYIRLEDEEGNDLTSDINMDTGEITFPQMGIYKVTLQAQDDGYRKSTAVIKIPVM